MPFGGAGFYLSSQRFGGGQVCHIFLLMTSDTILEPAKIEAGLQGSDARPP
jgi:hypothetical protein